MPDQTSLFSTLAQHAAPPVAAAIERLVRNGADFELNRINPLAFAARHGLEEGASIAGFLYATQAGLFELSWNVVCAGCGGVLHADDSLRHIDRRHYSCTLCAADCEPSLDERIEVTFTVDPRIRMIAAHTPENLSIWDYLRQVYFSSGSDISGDTGPIISDAVLDAVDLPPETHTVRNLQLRQGMAVIFDPVSHTSQFLEVAGAQTTEPQDLLFVAEDGNLLKPTIHLAPGPLRLRLENRTATRAAPIVWIAGEALLKLVRRRIPVLSASRLLTHQTFRDLYRTDVLNLEQRFTILNLTFMFTDLKGSTALYERVGDLAAFDLVSAHFQLLTKIIADHDGAVVKTIGDAVMATFPIQAQAIAAALTARNAMAGLNDRHGRQDILIKIGLHSGPCLAVMLNERQDYFGQTVNIAARIQGLASPDAILTTPAVSDDPAARALIEQRGLTVKHLNSTLRGIDRQMEICEIS